MRRGEQSASERDQGRLLAVVGVAPSQPFEFVILRVGREHNAFEITEASPPLGIRRHSDAWTSSQTALRDDPVLNHNFVISLIDTSSTLAMIGSAGFGDLRRGARRLQRMHRVRNVAQVGGVPRKAGATARCSNFRRASPGRTSRSRKASARGRRCGIGTTGSSKARAGVAMALSCC